jgi:hypothetical protein
VKRLRRCGAVIFLRQNRLRRNPKKGPEGVRVAGGEIEVKMLPQADIKLIEKLKTSSAKNG